eukprot:m.111136 g.111136  ORF g.111136 m.111136 type:complete len:52 (-) comp16993_c0_seq1:309-464(-)
MAVRTCAATCTTTLSKKHTCCAGSTWQSSIKHESPHNEQLQTDQQARVFTN